MKRLEELSTEQPGGPTAMQTAHANGMRKTISRMKSQLKDPDDAEALIRMGLLTYLKEWDSVYNEGISESVSGTTRTILVIRQDTVGQMMRELGES
jgi:hypothetical protein